MSRGKDRRRGGLTPEDRALWDSVTRSIKPLAHSDKEEARAAEGVRPNRPTPVPKDAAEKSPAIRKPHPTRHPTPSPHPSPPAGIDRRTHKRIAKGTIAIDARVDLHGLTQRQAHARLKSFLAGCHHRGDRHVLVITGKGGWQTDSRIGHDYGERGVLRRVVPHWLAAPEFRVFVAGFEEAHIAHGGGGAFYVRLRRRNAKHPR